MKPASPEPADLVPRLRQQLILAQVRIMELEDLRETLPTRLAEAEKILAQAQTLADRKIDEAAHLEKIVSGLQAQLAHVQQAQHSVVQELLNAHRALSVAQTQLKQQSEAAARLELAHAQLDTQLQALQSSRSWRWTAWLRALGRK